MKMASEFTELCETYGLSPGDPEAIDKLIHFIGESDDDGEDDSWYFNENADAFDPDLTTEEEDNEE